MTIRINHAPIFRALVAFTLAGEGEESCRFTFRHKTPAALIEWRKTIGTRPAHESMAEIVEGWEMWEAAKDLRVYDLTDGLLPVVFVWQTGQSEHAPA